jgi:hypothetical protein
MAARVFWSSINDLLIQALEHVPELELSSAKATRNLIALVSAELLCNLGRQLPQDAARDGAEKADVR